MTIYCGVDWAAHHHDVAIVNDEGKVVATRRIGEDAAGLTTLLMLLAEHAVADAGGVVGQEFAAVDVAIETGRGLLVNAVRAAGHLVFEINPKASSRYRDRHTVSGSKSDTGDALVLAHLLRTDRDRHRPMPAGSDQVRVLGVLARAQQDAAWTVLRDAGRLRAVLWEFYPAALRAFPNLHIASAVTVLAAAPTPIAAAKLSEADKMRLPGVHFHDLRHAGNIWASKAGMSTKDLMSRMGHDDMRGRADLPARDERRGPPHRGPAVVTHRRAPRPQGGDGRGPGRR